MGINPEAQFQFSNYLNDLYEFDPYFKSLESGEFFEERGLSRINEYVFLNKEIDKYRKIIMTLKKQKYDLNTLKFIMEGETFTQEIGLLDNPNSFYSVHWNIDKLHDLVKKHHINKVSVPIEIILSRLSPGSVPFVNESLPLKNDPIIALDYPLINELPKIIIADGNYRTVRKYSRGEREIEVFIIPSRVHLDAMLDKLSVTSYKIHHNCLHIINFIIGQIKTEKELKKMMFRFK